MAKEYDASSRFQTIADASRTTGLAQCFLRTGVKNNTIPHIMSGKKYLINIPRLIEQLDEESVQSMRAT